MSAFGLLAVTLRGFADKLVLARSPSAEVPRFRPDLARGDTFTSAITSSGTSGMTTLEPFKENDLPGLRRTR